MKGGRRVFCGFAAGVVCVAAPVAPAQAQHDEAAQFRAEKVTYAPTILVLDASGSMAGEVAGGTTKMDVAKKAVRSFADIAPRTADVGLVAYGANTGDSAEEKAAGCADVEVLHRPQPLDPEAITSLVDDLQPSGYTPIGKALRTAAGELPESRSGAVVLVSDGLDTCAPPDPCAVAGELADAGVDLTVHTVGFDVDSAAADQLRCIAERTGGSYTDAPDAGSLEDILPRVAVSALRSYEPVGRVVEGGDHRGDAPGLRPGQYLDEFDSGQAKHYTVDVAEGATVYFSATVPYSGQDDSKGVDALEIRVLAPDGKATCARERAIKASTEDAEVMTAAVALNTTDTPPACQSAGTFGFVVERDGAESAVLPTAPLEILVGVEPKVIGSEGAPAAEGSARARYEDQGGPERPVVGGGSFGNAAALDGPGTYTDSFRHGEYVFYRVKLDWGQSLAYRVRYDENEDAGTTNIATRLYNPMRQEIAGGTTAYTGSATVLPGPGKAVATWPVRYLNRNASPPAIQKQAVAGWYYIAVKFGVDEGNATSVGVHLDLAVHGEPEPGPGYVFGSEEGRDGGIFGDGGGIQVAPQPWDAARSGGEPGGEDAGDGFPWLVVLFGVSAAMLAAMVVTVVLRKRRSPRL